MPKAIKQTRNTKTAVPEARESQADELLYSRRPKNDRTKTVRQGKKNNISTEPSKTQPKPARWDGLQLAAECLRVLAHPHRLRMIQLLLIGRFNVGELAGDCGLPSNVASEHLRLMQRCGFLESQRESRNVYYRIREPHLAMIMQCIEARFITSSESS